MYQAFASLTLVWEHVFTLLCRLRCLLNLSSEQQKVSSDLSEKIKYKSFFIQEFWSAWYKIYSWLTYFYWLMHRPLTLHSINYGRTSLPPAFIVGLLTLLREKYPCNAIYVWRCMPTKAQIVRSANVCAHRQNKFLLYVLV